MNPKSKRLRLIAKFLISAAWLVVILEVAPRLFLTPTHLLAHGRLLGYDDSSWRLLWVMRHQLHVEQTITPATANLPRTGEYDEYSPTRGWAVKPSLNNTTPFGEGKFVNTNSKGLRGKTEYGYARVPGKKRILVLGDSFTFGTEVSDEETFSHYLESDLPDTEVLNLGVQGYGQDQMLIYLKDEGIKYHPDIVVLGFVFVDAYRNLWNFFAFAKPKFDLTSDGLKLTNVPVPTPEQVLAREPCRSRAVDLGTILREKINWASGVNERKARELTGRILDEMAATTRSIGAVPVFVYMPVYDEVPDSSPSRTSREQYFYDYCQAQGVACLFLRPKFREAIEQGAKFETRAHWNPEMHRIAAQEIAKFLVEKGLVQEKPLDAAHR
jgi:hypothetical protein